VKPFERNAANLVRSLSFYGSLSELGGVHLISAVVPYSVFNIAMLSTPVADIEGELERRIGVAAGHYAQRRAPWSFWLCEDLMGARTARRALKVFESRGLRVIAESPGMELEHLPPPRRPLPKLEYRLVGDRTTRSDFAHLAATCFRIPPSISARVYEGEESWQHPLKVWLGYREGLALTSSAVIEAGGGLGIYSVATLPGYRGQGLAEAVMRHSIDTARAEGAGGPLVLQSSPAGLELYRKLGFRRVTRYWILATD
jgi:GNAT superfamily N-acetyltransferase